MYHPRRVTVRTTLAAPRLPKQLDAVEVTGIDDEHTWEECEIRGDLAGALARNVTVERSRLVGVRLTGADLPRLRLIDCVLDGCDLSGAFLEASSWNRVELHDCRLSGTVLTYASMRHVRWARCRADGVVLRFATAEQFAVDECQLPRADLSSAQLTGVRFHDCDLSGADVSQAALAGTELHGSTLDGIVGAAALREVVISGGQIVPVALAWFDAVGIVVRDERTA